MLISRTSRSRFEKFCAMRSSMGVSFLNSDLFGTKAQLLKLFQEDSTLSQIPASEFDKYHSIYKDLRPGITMEETVCLIKHSLIYQVIGAVPEFID
jgi:hypothetical protein